jgi:S-adenosyl methyltransferase
MAVTPVTVEVSRENGQFLARAVTWAASQGTGQFIDLGCGLPTVPNTHETAQATAVLPGEWRARRPPRFR